MQSNPVGSCRRRRWLALVVKEWPGKRRWSGPSSALGSEVAGAGGKPGDGSPSHHSRPPASHSLLLSVPC